MTLNKLSDELVFKLYGNKLKIVKSHKYVGITMSTKKSANLYVEHFNVILDKASKRL